MEEITFTFDRKTGKRKIETSGFVGGACLEELKKYKDHMKSVGVDVNETHQTKKDEIYLTETQSDTVNQY